MWNGVVTNLGLSLLEQWAAGSETLYIDKATAGSGTVAQSNMRGSTYVQGEVGDVSIVASIPVTGGTQYRIQVSANPDAAYIMHQIGIWAHLGASGGTTLLALYQDEDGVSVPLEADDPGFGFTLYAVVSMSNQGSVSVNFDGGAYVTRDDFSSALAGYVKTVNENGPNSDGNVTLPVDATPTSGSTNPVSSDGVFDALAGKQATLTFDSTPTSGSTNPVTSGGVYTGLDGKQDKLTLPLAIAQGGTGATTAAAALVNLGAAPTVQCPNGTDANTLKNAGLYMIANDGVNLPNSAVNGYILVLSNTAGTRAKQLFMRHGTQNLNDFQTYVRQYNGAWGNWVKVLTAGQAVQITEGGTGCADLGSITTVTGATTNAANDTVTNIGSITLQAGIYMVQVSGHFNENATGYRQIGLATNATSQNIDRYTIFRVQASPTMATEVSFTYCMKVSSETTYYANARQTSGSTLSCYCGIRAMKIAAV